MVISIGYINGPINGHSIASVDNETTATDIALHSGCKTTGAADLKLETNRAVC